MKMIRTIFLGLAALFFVIAVPEPGAARQDQDEAQKARKRGDTLSYGEIKRRAESQFTGRVVWQDLRRTKAGWVYVLRLLMEDGKVMQVVMDAKTGRVISTIGG